ncbi:MAG: response regulator, partial [Gammaproteobacteria bacterium]|nr:response regulator [Gammaproteobacteria bacterium]
MAPTGCRNGRAGKIQSWRRTRPQGCESSVAARVPSIAPSAATGTPGREAAFRGAKPPGFVGWWHRQPALFKSGLGTGWCGAAPFIRRKAHRPGCSTIAWCGSAERTEDCSVLMSTINAKPPTVMIVDDSPEDRITYRYNLGSRYRIFETDTGERALALWRTARPDCVLLDYYLPDMTGLEVLEALDADGALDAFPVVLLTGNADTQMAVQALTHGAADFLEKSRAEPYALQRAVDNAIDKATLQHELDQQREWLAAILAGVGSGVIATDPDGCVSFLNEAAEALTDWSRLAAIGQPLTAVLNIVDEHSGAPRDLSAAGAAAPGSSVLIARSGRETPVELSSS